MIDELTLSEQLQARYEKPNGEDKGLFAIALSIMKLVEAVQALHSDLVEGNVCVHAVVSGEDGDPLQVCGYVSGEEDSPVHVVVNNGRLDTFEQN